MRIVAGIARGRRLQVPRGDVVRPTSDRVKEALFSSLQTRLPGARVLDLFAGAGGLGLEAASRGAARVVLVERDRRALASLRRNVEVVGLGGVEVHAGDVLRVLAGEIDGGPFDVALLDPPYDLDDVNLATVLDRLLDHLADGAVVIVERASRAAPVPWPSRLQADASRRYGDTTLHRATCSERKDGS